MAAIAYAAKGGMAVLALVALAGCTSFGTNVKGSFRCAAPDGQCAPSMTIDDQALAEIATGSADGFVSPAGPYKVDDGNLDRSHMADAKAAASSAPMQDNQRYQLSVVFPAYTDGAGVTHDRAVVKTEVGLPGRTASSVELANRGREGGDSRGLLAAAESAPPLLSLVRPATEPESALVTAGDAAPKARPEAIDQIKAEVDAKLAKRGRRQAASFPAQE